MHSECTRKDGAVGVDGQTAESYAANLRQNLTSLIERLKSGRYRALRVARSGDLSFRVPAMPMAAIETPWGRGLRNTPYIEMILSSTPGKLR